MYISEAITLRSEAESSLSVKARWRVSIDREYNNRDVNVTTSRKLKGEELCRSQF